jgi:pilus assembly protein Flp/PilA
MLNALTLLMNLKSDRRGVTAVEYGMIAALIAVAIVAIVGTLGGQLSAAFTSVSGALPAAH